MTRRAGHRLRGVRSALVVAVILGSSSSAAAQTLEPPPPTPVPVPGGGTSPSPFPSALRTPSPDAVEAPEIRAGSAVLMDLDSGQILFSLNATERRPIASLTKIMTAYLVMTRTSPTERVRVSERAASGQVVGISGLGLLAGETIKVQHLLYALLLQSANDAAVALAEHVGGTVETFVRSMNRTASRLGMVRTRFASPNGLDDNGYSTARDLARITRAAFAVNGFGEITSTLFHAIPAPDGDARMVQNRNALLWLYPGASGVKTGYTAAAGFCLVATAERGDERLLAVVLGEPGEPFSDAAALFNYGFAGFDRRTLIRDGDALGAVRIDGRAVEVAAGASLEGLVRTDAAIRRDVVVEPAVRFPPGRGQEIGTVALTTPGFELGQVPLVVTQVAPPPELADDHSWWSRALGAVTRAGAAVVDGLFG